MGNRIVMIDCGYRRIYDNPSRPTDIGYYLTHIIGENHINLLIITHLHHDHYLGIEDLLVWEVEVKELWESIYRRRRDDNSLTREEWEEYRGLTDRLVPPGRRYHVAMGDRRAFVARDQYGNIQRFLFTVLGPRRRINSDETRECHDGSLVVKVATPKNENFIICGDASDPELDFIRENWNLSSCFYLRASHHGSINGANIEFIQAVNPLDTIISTQSGIIPNLPHDTALSRYSSYTLRSVIRTDTQGTQVIPLL